MWLLLSKPKAPAARKDQARDLLLYLLLRTRLVRIVSQSGLGPGVPFKVASEDTVSGRSPLGRQGDPRGRELGGALLLMRQRVSCLPDGKVPEIHFTAT